MSECNSKNSKKTRVAYHQRLTMTCLCPQWQIQHQFDKLDFDILNDFESPFTEFSAHDDDSCEHVCSLANSVFESFDRLTLTQTE